MNETSCMLCKKKMTYAGFKKHIFSNFHKQDIINAIHRKRKAHEAWLAKYEASPATANHPIIRFTDKHNEGYHFCHVCKSMRSIAHGNILTCNHLKEIADFIKDCLKKDADVKEDNIVSNAEVELLKEKLKKAEERYKREHDLNVTFCEENGAYYSAICHVQENDTHAFNAIMSFMKKEEPAFHKQLLKNFDMDEE